MKKKISYRSYLITLIIILIVIWGQTRDEALLPEIKDNAQLIPQTSIINEQNAFFVMLGFNILDPNHMASAGYQTLQKTIEEAKKNPFEYGQLFEIPKTSDKELDLYKLPCDAEQVDQNCLTEIAAQQYLIEDLLKEQQQYIENYLVIQKYNQFAHLFPRNVNASLPILYISGLSQLLTAKAILDIKAGHIDQGMRFILNDIKFYRQMLNSEQRTLEETNTFITALLQHYFVLDRLVHSGINLSPYLAELTPLLAPLSKQQRSLVWALENERNTNFIVQISMAYQFFYTGDNKIAGCQKNSCSVTKYFSRLIYKFNATLNATYQDWQPTIAFAQQDYPLDENYLNLLKSLQQVEINHHQLTAARLYERYGLFLFKNYEGEKQKNSFYYTNGYTLWFMKVYLLNNLIKQVDTVVKNTHNS